MFKKSKTGIGIAHTNLKQFIISRTLYISIVLIILVMFLSYFSSYPQGVIGNAGVCDLTFSMFYFGIIPKLIILISGIPVVLNFCSDWNTQYIRAVVSRTGIAKYARHKVLMCMSGTFITAFTALLLFTLLLMLKHPLITEEDIINLDGIYPFGCIVEKYPFLYQLIRITCFSAFCSVWNVIGLAISAFITNRYVICAAPFIVYFVFEQIFINLGTINTPAWVSLPYLGLTAMTIPLFENPVIDFTYIILLFFGLSLLIGEVFVYGVKKEGKK